MSEKWVELKDVPVGRLVVLKGLDDMVRVEGKGRFFPKTHMSLDVGRLENSGPVLMEYQNNQLCRMATLDDIGNGSEEFSG